MDENKINWQALIDDWGRALLAELGIDLYWDGLPTDHNPLTKAIKADPNFVIDHEYKPIYEMQEAPRAKSGFKKVKVGETGDKRFNRKTLSRLATICQMVVYDAQLGPEGDSNPKPLRRHWYAWYKVNLAAPLSEQYGEDSNDEKWGLNWSGRLSQTYGELVDNDGVTYKDLWIQDNSRITYRFEALFKSSNIIIALEKDSLIDDFKGPAASLGATALVSGKGKNSKAATEKVLRDHFSWPGREEWDYQEEIYTWTPAFQDDEPLYIIHISDYDYDGREVIGPTFGEQARRYVSDVREARVGVEPLQVSDKGYSYRAKWYPVKVKKNNKAYVEWAEQYALFETHCYNCGETKIVTGDMWAGNCDHCGGQLESIDLFENMAYGFEVEAMNTGDYRDLLVYALLRIMPFEYVVEKLRDEIQADNWEATQAIIRSIQADNQHYSDLLTEIERLETVARDFENEINNVLAPIAEEHKGDFRDDGDDPIVDEYVGHVVQAYGSPWRPFDQYARTELLIEFLNEDQEETITSFKERPLAFKLAEEITDNIADFLDAEGLELTTDQLAYITELIDR